MPPSSIEKSRREIPRAFRSANHLFDNLPRKNQVDVDFWLEAKKKSQVGSSPVNKSATSQIH
jgi:hypothetical protein